MHDEDLFEHLPCVDLKGIIVLNLRVSNINKVIYRFKFNSNLSKKYNSKIAIECCFNIYFFKFVNSSFK